MFSNEALERWLNVQGAKFDVLVIRQDVDWAGDETMKYGHILIPYNHPDLPIFGLAAAPHEHSTSTVAKMVNVSMIVIDRVCILEEGQGSQSRSQTDPSGNESYSNRGAAVQR